MDAGVRAGSLPPFVLAAPTQTRDAVRAKTLWTDFDLAAFLDDLDGAIAPARARRDAIVVVGHSGAGCNAGRWSRGGGGGERRTTRHRDPGQVLGGLGR